MSWNNGIAHVQISEKPQSVVSDDVATKSMLKS